MTVSLSLLAGAGWQFLDDNANPLTGGLLYTYEAGSSTPVTTYTSSAATTANANPIVLDAAGRVSEQIWLNTAYTYKFVLKTSAGVTVWTKDNIPATSAATTISSALVQYQPAGAGAVTTTVQTKLRESVSVKDFGAVGDGVTDDTAAIQAAITAASNIHFPAGTYKTSSTVTIPSNRNLYGDGAKASTISYTGTGDALLNAYPVNGSNAAHVVISDLGLVCTNGSNTGAGFDQVCGSFVKVIRVFVQGFKYGIIFDQTEVSLIDQCHIQANTTGGVWLVNGSEHSPGASVLYTNVITISNTEFNVTGIGILDDGGGNHFFVGNNINGGSIGIRVSGAGAVLIQNNGIEGQTSYPIFMTSVTNGGVSVGTSYNVKVDSNFVIAVSGNPCIGLGNANTLTLSNNQFQGGTGGVYVVSGVSSGSVAKLTSYNNVQVGFSGLLSGVSASFYQNDEPTGGRNTFTQLYSAANTDSAIETYCPSSAGGGTSISGIDLSANNNAASKVVYARIRPAINGNGAGAETGSLNLELVGSGTRSTRYTFANAEFLPAVDNTINLGKGALRWGTVYAGTGTINTSDEREKRDVADIDAAEKRVAVALKGSVKKFRFKDAVQAKGDAARIHVGVIAQEVMAAFQAEGLDPMRYAIVCYDEWDAELDEDGHEVRPAGNRYGVRYEELMAFIISAL